MTRVKVCGITRERDLRVAVDAGADAVGLLCEVTVDSPREVDPERAADLADATPPFVTTVLVTMAGHDRIGELVERVDPDAVQVHGAGPPADLAALSADASATVLRAVEAPEAADYADAADGLLVDSLDADGAGGTGRTQDWARTREAVAGLDAPVILAGGLTPDNVAEAVRTVEPYGVDVASGVEAAGGEKDPEAVRAFVSAARGAV